MKRAFVCIAAVGAVTALLLVLARLRPPDSTLLWLAVFDAGHVPLFGMVSLLLLAVSASLIRVSGRWRGIHYLVAFTVAMLVGLGSEVLQYAGPRDADFVDLVRNACGSVAFLLAAAALDAKLGVPARRRGVALGVALLLMVAPLVPVLAIARDYAGRNAAFPSLCDFESSWEELFVRGRGARLERRAPPPEWVESRSARAGRLTFLPGRYPGLAIAEPVPDWSAYDRLVFEAYSELARPIELVLRIHDIHHDETYSDRYNGPVSIVPGSSRIVIPLAEVRAAPRGRTMDLTAIRGVALFAVRPPEPIRVYVDAFRLERD